MSRKDHAPGAGGGEEKGRSSGDQQAGGVTGGKLGGTNPLRYHGDVSGRRGEAGHAGGDRSPATEQEKEVTGPAGPD
ncbi:hypothetical protein [Roseicella aquatilis]|uniref:Uncharacterized protein n=1 Tax=Roseicella aquatilis TaxID=2527868 RepID=A0A4R4DHR8_9PROT|nr:hypothetical protein [Roseicella aquatilis]TCZ59815.1 hypothetical protein EXY23_14500 [Roseicella aquatilis]